MKHFISFLFVLCLFSCNGGAHGQATLVGKVIGIKDGDTIELLVDGKPVVVRLFGIDCPEKAQAFGKAAKHTTSSLTFGKIATLLPQGRPDRYKRIVGILFVDGVNINEQLLRRGLAWHFTQYSNNADWTILQDSARKQKLGLWADRSPIAPWEWRQSRRQHRQALPAY